MSNTTVRELIIIGGGPAGYTAALYAARADLEPLVIEGFAWGGQLMITSDVENYPGYADGVMGPEMMSDFRRQAERFGAEFITDDVTSVDFSEQPVRASASATTSTARTSVIVATGASARWLELPSEERLKGRGVSACATCDASFFRDKDVYVVGGGDTAFEEALFLTKFASRVHLVHRRDEFRASRIMVDRAEGERQARLRPERGRRRDPRRPEGRGAAPAQHRDRRDVGGAGRRPVRRDRARTRTPRSSSTQLDHDANGYLVTKPGSTETNIPGVFAAGDVQDHTYRQAVTAAGSGCMAALDAERYLACDARRPHGTPRRSKSRNVRRRG